MGAHQSILQQAKVCLFFKLIFYFEQFLVAISITVLGFYFFLPQNQVPQLIIETEGAIYPYSACVFVI